MPSHWAKVVRTCIFAKRFGVRGIPALLSSAQDLPELRLHCFTPPSPKAAEYAALQTLRDSVSRAGVIA